MSNLPAINRVRAAVVIAASTVFVVSLVIPAFATESQTEPDATVTTIAEPVFENGEPAVVIPVVEPEAEEQPWTSRFIYPTIVAVTIILIIGLLIGYNRSIRHRYKVVS